MPLIETLTDDFDDGVIDTSKWASNFGTVGEAGGRGRIRMGTAYNAFRSAAVYSLRGSGCHVQVFLPQHVAGVDVDSFDFYLEPVTAADGGGGAGNGTNISASVDLEDNRLRLMKRVDWWETEHESLNYDPGQHRWMRIREASGRLLFETSPDGVVWTVRRDTSPPPYIDADDFRLVLEGHRSAGPADRAEVDLVNLPPIETHSGSGATTVDLTATGAGARLFGIDAELADRTGGDTVTTDPFDVAANSLLVAQAAATATAPVTAGVSSSVPLTWHLVGSRGPADGGHNVFVAAWWAWSNAAHTGVTVTADLAGATDVTVKATTFLNADFDVPVAATQAASSTSNALSAQSNVTVVPTHVLMVAADANNLGDPTSSDTIDTADGAVSGGYVRTSAPVTSPALTTLDADAPGADPAAWNYVAFEVRGGGAAASRAGTGTVSVAFDPTAVGIREAFGSVSDEVAFSVAAAGEPTTRSGTGLVTVVFGLSGTGTGGTRRQPRVVVAPRPVPTWRFVAARMLSGEILRWEVPLRDVGLTRALSATTSLTATIDPADQADVLTAIHADGLPVLDVWSTAIFAEDPGGSLRFGGPVVQLTRQGSALTVECAGYYGWLRRQHYTGKEVHYRGGDFADPLGTPDPQRPAHGIIRYLVNWLQDQPDADVGVVVDGAASSPIRVGSGDDPVSYNPWQHPNIGEEIDQLAGEHPGFDFTETHEWVNDVSDEIRHRLTLRYPRAGRRRHDIWFETGANISADEPETSSGDDYANVVLADGAGEGSKALREVFPRRDGRPRVTAVVEATHLTNKDRLKAFARTRAQVLGTLGQIESIQVIDHPNARLGSWQLGDDVQVTVETGWGRVRQWCRITGDSWRPDDANVATLELVRADSFTYGSADGP